MGDCQLIQKKSGEALSLYRRADEGMPSGSDEALYRIATIYGRWGQYQKQIETLDRISRRTPSPRTCLRSSMTRVVRWC